MMLRGSGVYTEQSRSGGTPACRQAGQHDMFCLLFFGIESGECLYGALRSPKCRNAILEKSHPCFVDTFFSHEACDGGHEGMGSLPFNDGLCDFFTWCHHLGCKKHTDAINIWIISTCVECYFIPIDSRITDDINGIA